MATNKNVEDRPWSVEEMLAVAMATTGVRNKLEGLHTGQGPTTETGDWSDVKVVFPGGEIAWQELSRIDDDEMRDLMITVTDDLYAALVRTAADPMLALAYVQFAAMSGARKFQRPSVPDGFDDSYGPEGILRTGASEQDLVSRIANEPELLRKVMFEVFRRGRTDCAANDAKAA